MWQNYPYSSELSTKVVNDENPLRFMRILPYAADGGREMIETWASMQSSLLR
jgi:hypothetical protein